MCRLVATFCQLPTPFHFKLKENIQIHINQIETFLNIDRITVSYKELWCSEIA